jgi:hypothetical protein
MTVINDEMKTLIDNLENLQYRYIPEITEIENRKNQYRINDYEKFEEVIALLNRIKLYIEKLHVNLERGTDSQALLINELRDTISRLVRDDMVQDELLTELDKIKDITNKLKNIKNPNYNFEYEDSPRSQILITDTSRFIEPSIRQIAVSPPPPPSREKKQVTPPERPKWVSSVPSGKLFSDYSYQSRPSSASSKPPRTQSRLNTGGRVTKKYRKNKLNKRTKGNNKYKKRKSKRSVKKYNNKH